MIILHSKCLLLKKDIQVLNHSCISGGLQFEKRDFVKDMSVFRVRLNGDDDDRFAMIGKSFRSDFFTVFLIVEGYIDVKVNFKESRFVAGNLLISDQSSIKQVIHISEGCLLEGVSFTAEFIRQIKFSEKFLRRMDIFPYRYNGVWAIGNDEKDKFSQLLANLQVRMERAGHHTYGAELLANGFSDFIYELAEIGNKHIVPNDVKIGRKEELVRKFLQLAVRNHIKEHYIAYYSDKLFVTAKYLSETVKEITQETAGEVLSILNLMEAKRLLEETEFNISEIAFRMNFSTPAFFSKFFKRMSGQSPREYRRNGPVSRDGLFLQGV